MFCTVERILKVQDFKPIGEGLLLESLKILETCPWIP